MSKILFVTWTEHLNESYTEPLVNLDRLVCESRIVLINGSRSSWSSSPDEHRRAVVASERARAGSALLRENDQITVCTWTKAGQLSAMTLRHAAWWSVPIATASTSTWVTSTHRRQSERMMSYRVTLWPNHKQRFYSKLIQQPLTIELFSFVRKDLEK